MLSMHYVGRVISNVKDFYNEINGATLTGAIDVIVVEQPNGSFNCSPFHVRFGKLGVLRSREKVVDISINGEPRDIHMKLGESGEAFFVEELEDDDNEIPDHLATSPIPVSELQNIFNIQGRRRSLDLGTEPAGIVGENQVNDYSKRRNTTDNDSSKVSRERNFIQRHIGLGNIDMGEHSGDDLTLSIQSNTIGPSSEDISKNDISENIFKMDSLETESSLADTTDPKISQPVTPNDSISETRSAKRRRRKTKKKNAPRKSTSNNQLPLEVTEKGSESPTDKSSLTSSSNSESEIKGIHLEESQPAPNRMVLDPEFHFFSDTELNTTSNVHSKNNSPVNQVASVQSDSEVEVKTRKGESPSNGQSWEWGGFPQNQIADSESGTMTKQEKKMSMISSMLWFMKNKHANQNSQRGGVYLSDISSGNVDPEVAGLYFPEVKKRHDGDMDCESGNGPSLAQSPNSADGSKSVDSDFDDQNKLAQTYINDISISSCGWIPEPNPDRFLEHVISFSDLCNNPMLLESDSLVIRIKDKYYNWKVAAPLITSLMIYRRPLPQSSIEQLCNAHMPISTKGNMDKNQTKHPEKPSFWWNWGRAGSSREATPAADNAVPKGVDTKDGPTETDVQTEAVVPTETVIPNSTENNEKEKDAITPEESKKTDISFKSTQEIPSDNDSPKISSDKCRKTLRLSSRQIASLNLKDGVNEIKFSVTTAYQGTAVCKCHLYKWRWDDQIVISDIDGTITKSDVLGHILPAIGKDWAQSGVAQLFNKIADNGYKILYLSARAIGQANTTREYLKSIKQGDLTMPDGPVLLNPTSLISAFHREVIEKKPEQFKIQCMSDIKALFPRDASPFYAGYGNKINDVWAYRAVGIPIVRIYTINPKGELKHELTQTYQSSYSGQSLVVNDVFPVLHNKLVDISDSDEIESDMDTSDLENRI